MSGDNGLESHAERLVAAGALPAWADSLLHLGAALYRHRTAGTPAHACLTVPTGSMAAALVASGAALASLVDDTGETLDDHYKRLCGLEPGTPIAALVDGRMHGGWIEGPRTVMGEECIAYIERRTHRNERRYLFKDRCRCIEPLPIGSEPFAVPRTPFQGEASGQILRSLNPDADVRAALQHRYASVVLSTISQVERDFNEELELREGTIPLVDLARPQRLLPAGFASRTQLVPSSAEDGSDLIEGDPVVAIYDGPQGYIRLRHRMTDISSVLIIDRWDNNAESAASAFLAEERWPTRRRHLKGFSPVAGMEFAATEADH